MSKMKKCKVVMLPTNEKAEDCLLLSSNSKDIFYKKGYFTQSYLTEIGRTAQHLYIASDEEIKEGDWFITKANNLIKSDGNNQKLFECLKLIATTDSSIACVKDTLSIPQRKGLTNHYSTEKWILPKPSIQFIQKFIEEYNKGMTCGVWYVKNQSSQTGYSIFVVNITKDMLEVQLLRQQISNNLNK